MLPTFVSYFGSDCLKSLSSGYIEYQLHFTAEYADGREQPFTFIVDEQYQDLLEVRINNPEEKARKIDIEPWMRLILAGWYEQYKQHRNLNCTDMLFTLSLGEKGIPFCSSKKIPTLGEVRVLGKKLMQKLSEKVDVHDLKQLKNYIVALGKDHMHLSDALRDFVSNKVLNGDTDEYAIYCALDILTKISLLIATTYTTQLIFGSKNPNHHVTTWLDYCLQELRPGLLQMYQEQNLEALTKEIDYSLKIARRYNADILTPEPPAAYFHLTQRYQTPLDKAKALLVDYTKGSNWTLFWTGHWNRHYIKEVQTILDRMDTTNSNREKPITDLETLMDVLDEINPKNLEGSLAKRMKFIRQMHYESKYHFEMHEPEEATWNCFSNNL